nr:mitochondria-eating protein isoform X2 [Taeniopygia guttata]
MAEDLKCLVGGGSARELHERLESCQQNYEDSTGELQLRDLACKPKCELQDLEDKLRETRVQINEMERDLKASRAEQCSLRRLQQLDSYEQKIEKLRDEIAMLDCKKSVIQSRLARTCSPRPCRLRPCISPPCHLRACSPPCRVRACSPPCRVRACSPCPVRACSPCPVRACSPCPVRACSPPCPVRACSPPPCPVRACSPPPCRVRACSPLPCRLRACSPPPCRVRACSPPPCRVRACSPLPCRLRACSPPPCRVRACSPLPCRLRACSPPLCRVRSCSPPCRLRPCVSPCRLRPCVSPCRLRPCVSPCRLRPCSPPPCRLRPCVRPPKCRALCVRPCSPPRLRRGSASHRACLIARYNFIYAKERLAAEATLKQYFCDLETIHRILYIAAVESFRSAKMAFWKVRINVKDTLAVCHRGGPSSLEVAVLDYIACHKDLYDVCCSVHEVVCTMNKNPKFLCPGQVDFAVISPLIRELCCLAFSMQTLIPPLDVAFGVDGECFNRNMYYRSFDSDFTAPFVAYHVWPPLIEDGTVIVKGEVVTKKFTCPRKCRLRSRSCSCGRPLLCGQVPRSRSLSTVRVKRRC